MVEATDEIVNKTLSFHKDLPDLQNPQKYYQDFITIRPKGMGSIAKIITRAVWSDCIWKEGKRSESNFEFSDYCVLDIDGGYDLGQACKELSDTAHVIATTKSHTGHQHRFRIIMPWTHRICSVDLYRYNVEQRIKKFDADPAGIDAARFFWPCRDVVSVVEPEDAFFAEEVSLLPENYKSFEEKQRLTMERHLRYASDGGIHPWVKNALINGAEDGERNSTIYSLSKYLTYYGWSYEKILDAILRSKVPLPSAPRKEIETAIRSGIKKASKVMRGGH